MNHKFKKKSTLKLYEMYVLIQIHKYNAIKSFPGQFNKLYLSLKKNNLSELFIFFLDTPFNNRLKF